MTLMHLLGALDAILQCRHFVSGIRLAKATLDLRTLYQRY